MRVVLLVIILSFLSSCASVDSVKKSPDCVVWKDQKYWGPFSIEVVENKVYWNSKCKGYNSGCKELDLKVDESKNVLLGEVVLGKIEDNQITLVENHALAGMINYKTLKAITETKHLKSVINDEYKIEEAFQYNAKCTTEAALLGGVALSAIKYLQASSNK